MPSVIGVGYSSGTGRDGWGFSMGDHWLQTTLCMWTTNCHLPFGMVYTCLYHPCMEIRGWLTTGFATESNLESLDLPSKFT